LPFGSLYLVADHDHVLHEGTGEDDGLPGLPGVIVVFGSINLDLIFPVAELPRPGHTVLGASMTIEPGGKGANQAVAAARDGAVVAMVGAVGRDALADDALALLRQNGVDLSRVAQADTATGCAAICVDPQGRNQIAVAGGANLFATQVQVEDSLLTPATILLLQMETDPAETAALVARARSRGARIVLNLAPAAALPIETLRALDLLVVNEHEADFLATLLDCAATASGLHAALGVDVVVTLGGAGLDAVAKGGRVVLAALPIQAVDTTAAGDCFTGVLVSALDRGLTLDAALARANAAGGLCCTRPGSQRSMPDAMEIDAAVVGRIEPMGSPLA
jgi:ribokinase